MREVIVSIKCDNCEAQFVEQDEGSNSVGLIIEKRHWEIDLCSICLEGPLFDNAREVTTKPEKSTYPCPLCAKPYRTKRGLDGHTAVKHQGRS